MSFPPPVTIHRRFPAGARGFTLVEIALVAVIIGLLAVLAVPTSRMIRARAAAAAVNNDFRVIAGAFQQYASENGSKWPAEQAKTSATLPAGMAGYLRATNWGKPTPFGGYYNWDYKVKHQGRTVKAAIAIYAQKKLPLRVTRAQLLEFDRRFDDGNLKTGSFQLGASNCPLFIIEH